MEMFNAEHLQEKWDPILSYDGAPKIQDAHRKMVTAVLLENQEKFLREQNNFLYEAGPTNSGNSAGSSGAFGGTASSASGSPTAGFDPVLISLIRRSMPNLVAYDLAGVQPMNGPTGLIFAMRSRKGSQTGDETFFDEVDTAFSGQDDGNNTTQGGYTGQASDGVSVGFGTTSPGAFHLNNPGALNPSTQATQGDYAVGQGMSTGDAEALGGGSGDQFNEMAFSIEKVTVTAKSRALKAEYSLELAQDLKAIHGLNAEGLLFQIERDANSIAQRTRRGKGNMILCSADVASALTMAGVLDYTPALNANLQVDDAGNTFAGVLQGKYRVYIDPYSANSAIKQYYVVGYKGSSPYDAGLFYCPYVPLQMVRAVGQDTFQPKIGFKTRYGMVANPFAEGTTEGFGRIKANSNRYYQRVTVTNLM